jgi:hypothetical protein
LTRAVVDVEEMTTLFGNTSVAVLPNVAPCGSTSMSPETLFTGMPNTCSCTAAGLSPLGNCVTHWPLPLWIV